jgi:hypothetical protein
MLSRKKKRGGYACFYQHVDPTGFKKMLFVFQPLRGGILVAKKTSPPSFSCGNGGRSSMLKGVSQEYHKLHSESSDNVIDISNRKLKV